MRCGRPVSLSPTEFTLLRYFIINAGTVLSKPKSSTMFGDARGGTVGVTTAPGQGCTFRVVLPRIADVAAQVS